MAGAGEVAGRLSALARSYHRDAQRLARLGEVTDGMTGEQWSLVYRAVSDELRKCAAEIGRGHNGDWINLNVSGVKAVRTQFEDDVVADADHYNRLHHGTEGAAS